MDCRTLNRSGLFKQNPRCEFVFVPVAFFSLIVKIRVTCPVIDKRDDTSLYSQLAIFANCTVLVHKQERPSNALNASSEKLQLDHLLVTQIDLVVFANNQHPRRFAVL